MSQDLGVDVIGLGFKILINWGGVPAAYAAKNAWRSPSGLRGQERVIQFIISSWTRFFTDSMRMFEEFTSVRFCAHFHTVGELLDPSNVMNVNQFVIRFDKVIHIQ
jgi:hypothetical protein